MRCRKCVHYGLCEHSTIIDKEIQCRDFISKEDFVEVVRCCDCKHKQENPDINNTCYLTCNLKYGIRGTVDPTDFCSYGERKDDKDG